MQILDHHNLRDRIHRPERRLLRKVLARAALGLFALAVAAPEAAADFAADWKKLIAEAQKEGVVSIAGGGAPSRQYQKLFAKFQENFNVKVEVARGGADQTISRVLAERQAKKYTVDIALISVRVNNQRLMPSGSLVPVPPLLIHPEVTDTSKWYGGKHWYGDKESQHTLFYTAAVIDKHNFWYNTEKISAADVASVKTPWDFLTPKWRGKIGGLAAEDPSGIRQLIDSWISPDMGPEWVKKYILDAGVIFTSDRRVLESWIVKGRYPIKIIAGAEEELRGLAAKGIPVKEGVLPTKVGMLQASGSGCCISVFANAPHPNATKLFLNWFLTKEGQTLIHTTIPNIERQSLREDIPYGLVVEENRRIPGKTYNYPDADPKSGEVNKKIQDEIMKIWRSRQRKG